MDTHAPGSPGKKIRLGCGALLVVILVFLFWWSRNPIVFTAPEGLFSEVTARQVDDPTGSTIVVELELSGETSGYTITELSLGRELATKLGVSAPAGFEEELLPLEEEELDDPESVRFVNEWNEENRRWTGGLEISPATPLVVRIPATYPLAASGPLTISYEQVSLMGGHWSSTTLVVNEAEGAESGRLTSSSDDD